MFPSEVSRLSDTTRIKTPLCFSRFSYVSPRGNETSNQSQRKQKKQSQRTLILLLMTGAHCVYRRQKRFIEMHKAGNVGINGLHRG